MTSAPATPVCLSHMTGSLVPFSIRTVKAGALMVYKFSPVLSGHAIGYQLEKGVSRNPSGHPCLKWGSPCAERASEPFPMRFSDNHQMQLVRIRLLVEYK